MEQYTFTVTQPAFTCYRANITIEAENEEEAITKIKALPENELDEMAEPWELSDEADPIEKIEVWTEEGDNIREFLNP